MNGRVRMVRIGGLENYIHTAFFQWKRHFFPAAQTPTGSTFRSDSSVFGRTYSTYLH